MCMLGMERILGVIKWCNSHEMQDPSAPNGPSSVAHIKQTSRNTSLLHVQTW